MFCLSFLVTNCLHGDLEGLQRAIREGSEQADSLSQQTSSARQQTKAALQRSQRIIDTLQSIQPTLNPSVLVKIKELLEMGKDEKEMILKLHGTAQNAVNASQSLTASLQRGIDSLPQALREETLPAETNDAASPSTPRNSTTEDPDETVLRQLLDHLDDDLSETETLSRGVESIDIFTAASRGKDAYRSVLLQKQTVCLQLFDHIQSLASKIQQLSQSLLTGTCCDQFTALMSAADALLQCRQWSRVIQRATEAARRLLDAVVTFVQKAWDKFSGFLQEFDAAKKLGRFVSNIRPFQGKVGKAAMNVVGDLLGR